MGNSQSIEAHRRPGQRLSKPKTGSRNASSFLGSRTSVNNNGARSSTSALPSPRPSPLDSVPSSNSPTKEVEVSEHSLNKSSTNVSVRPQSSRRRSLFRSQSTAGQRGRTDEQVDSAAGTMSRASSMTYESAVLYYGPQRSSSEHRPQPGTRTSWHYDMTSYEAKRLMNMIEEGQLETHEVSDMKLTTVTESVGRKASPSQPAVTTISRANSDLSLYTPIRRRSMAQTPGVATRSSSARPSSTNRHHRHSLPATPSLSRQQSFESRRSGIMSMPPPPLNFALAASDPIPRVVTPCEEEYTSIGAFKLGTLRITNGSASPGSPEAEGRPREPRELKASGRLDYFSRDMRNLGPDSTKLGLQYAKDPSSVNLLASSAQISEHQISTRNVALDSAEQLALVVENTLAPLAIADAPPASPTLVTTSKHTALEDELFEDENSEIQPEYGSAEVLDVRLDPNAKSQHVQSLDSTSPSKLVARTDSGFVSTTSPSSEHSAHPLSKADSGYSSNVSLRSFHAKGSKMDAESSGLQNSQRRGSIQPDASLKEKRNVEVLEQLLKDTSPPPVPPKDYGVMTPMQPKVDNSRRELLSTISQSTQTPVSKPSQETKKTRASPSPIATIRSTGSGLRSPDPTPATPVSVHSVKSAASARSGGSGSALSIGSGTQRGNKLQRLLSSARHPSTGPPVVHTTHVSEETRIPAVPREVENKLNQHAGLFPLANKRLALKPRPSIETLKTILSVGSQEIPHEPSSIAMPVVSPVFEPVEAKPQKSADQRQRARSLTSTITTVASHLVSKRSARKSDAAQRFAAVNEELNQPPPLPEQQLAPMKADEPIYNLARNRSEGNVHNTRTAHSDRTEAKGDVRPYSNSHVGPRAMSLTAMAEQTSQNPLPRILTRPSTSSEHNGSVPSSLPSPILASMLELERQARGSPPVSMVTRRHSGLRVPQPLRSNYSSTTPSGPQSLSRRTSRESILSYPSASRNPSRGPSRKGSREDVRSYPSYHQAGGSLVYDTLSPPPIPAMSPRRDSWTKAERDKQNHVQPSRKSMDSIHRNASLSPTHQNQQLAWQTPANHPPLRHRASYDSYKGSYTSTSGSRVEYSMPRGNPPSMSNGYTAPSPKLQSQPFDLRGGGMPSQGKQSGRTPPPQVHRGPGHFRNRSLGSRDGYGGTPPYRVLHSYNSPAYRNAPIWG